MASRTHYLNLPLTRADIAPLRVGDMVFINGTVTMTIGLPTHARMLEYLDAGTPLPIDLREGAFFHLSCFNREIDADADADESVPAGAGTSAAAEPRHEALYMNPTTSTRYVAYMPRLIEGYGLRLIGGKGGLDQASIDALQRQGCVYLSFLGGGCTLLSKAIKRVVAVHWTDYISQFRLVTLEVESLGPATVAIDSHGNSVYERLRDEATGRMPAILEALNASRPPRA